METLDPHFILSNGMLAGDFALLYVIGYNSKRSKKSKTEEKEETSSSSESGGEEDT
jgi:hypothetical protein